MIVIDASVVVHLLLPTVTSGFIRERVFAFHQSFHAPHLIDIEVTHVLRRFLLHGDISLPRANEAFQDFREIAIEKYPHGKLLARIWQLRDNLTSYDAAYLALAEALDSTLVTCDGGLAEIARRSVRTELL